MGIATAPTLEPKRVQEAAAPLRTCVSKDSMGSWIMEVDVLAALTEDAKEVPGGWFSDVSLI